MVAAVVVDDVVAVTANHRHAHLVTLILGCSLDTHVPGKSWIVVILMMRRMRRTRSKRIS